MLTPSQGTVRPDLFQLQDEGVPIDYIVQTTQTLLRELAANGTPLLPLHIDSPEWRTWSNPEFLLSSKGVRLEELPDALRQRCLAVLQSFLSPEGYAKALGAMRINGFLGELVQAPSICNDWSYNLVVFGTPSVSAPWGISFYGHHLCLNVLFHQRQMVLSPWFTGAEPNVIDSGPYAGTRILHEEEALGLQLMQSLAPAVQARAQIFKLMKDPAMPRGRWNHDDQRHVCGAYRDNRVVPYEGVTVGAMDAVQRGLVEKILEQYLLYLPATARKMRLAQCAEWWDETYFCWIGGFGDEDPFYFRIQSPVILVEFDHHSGVFLTNGEPAKFHIHTLLRTPNGGDYGLALKGLIPGVEQEYLWEP